MARKDEGESPVHILTFEDILAAQDIGEKIVPVPEWGGSVRIRSFTKNVELRMRAEARDPTTGQVDTDKLELLMLVYGVVEPELTMEQVPHLRTKSATAIDDILLAITRLNRTNPEAMKAAIATFPAGPGEADAVPIGTGPVEDGQ